MEEKVKFESPFMMGEKQSRSEVNQPNQEMRDLLSKPVTKRPNFFNEFKMPTEEERFKAKMQSYMASQGSENLDYSRKEEVRKVGSTIGGVGIVMPPHYVDKDNFMVTTCAEAKTKVAGNKSGGFELDASGTACQSFGRKDGVSFTASSGRSFMLGATFKF